MNIGYFWWGHLGDKLSPTAKDTPDGNAFYSSFIINHLHSKLGHNVYAMSIDRDKACFDIAEYDIFNSFAKDYRVAAYKCLDWAKWSDKWDLINPPELDYLLLEWRFPIVGRNDSTMIGQPGFQPDLLMQANLLKHYLEETDTKLVILDLDYKLTEYDEKCLATWADRILILETAVSPKEGILRRKSIYIPCAIDKDILMPIKVKNRSKELCYVGSRYERDDVIEKYLIPYSEQHKYKVWFYGNWPKYMKDVMDLKWYYIQYHGRIGHSNFNEAYGDAIACPLIAKKAYFDNGFMTARILECLVFGCIPIGFAEHKGIAKFLPNTLIANNANELALIVNWLQSISQTEYTYIRNDIFMHLNFMDVKNFCKEMLF